MNIALLLALDNDVSHKNGQIDGGRLGNCDCQLFGRSEFRGRNSFPPVYFNRLYLPFFSTFLAHP